MRSGPENLASGARGSPTPAPGAPKAQLRCCLPTRAGRYPGKPDRYPKYQYMTRWKAETVAMLPTR